MADVYEKERKLRIGTLYFYPKLMDNLICFYPRKFGVQQVTSDPLTSTAVGRKRCDKTYIIRLTPLVSPPFFLFSWANQRC
jgi:hypothetical protein